MKILITKSTRIVQFVLRKLVKNQEWKFWLRNQRPNPPSVINRKHLDLETPTPSADYVICERPLITIRSRLKGWFLDQIFYFIHIVKDENEKNQATSC